MMFRKSLKALWLYQFSIRRQGQAGRGGVGGLRGAGTGGRGEGEGRQQKQVKRTATIPPAHHLCSAPLRHAFKTAI